MDIEKFSSIFNDKNMLLYKKLSYKYGSDVIEEYLTKLYALYAIDTSLCCNDGSGLKFIPGFIQSLELIISDNSLHNSTTSVIEEIYSTLSIENIHSTRESIKNIIDGYAPITQADQKSYGIKKGIDYIINNRYEVNKETLRELYEIACNGNVDEECRLAKAQYYRSGPVYVIGDGVDVDVLHTGAEPDKISMFMDLVFEFIKESKLSPIQKSIIVHYSIAHIHPYFDGNGRIARLVQLWVLVNAGYDLDFCMPISKYINLNRARYYKCFEQIHENKTISGVWDVTPFVKFFYDYIICELYRNMQCKNDNMSAFDSVVKTGAVTVKEKDLYLFALQKYGSKQFTTKQLEKAHGDVAYATVRSFCIKFAELGILNVDQMKNKNLYSLKNFY